MLGPCLLLRWLRSRLSVSLPLLQTGWSTEEKARLHRHAGLHVPRLGAIMAAHAQASHAAVLRSVLSLLVRLNRGFSCTALREICTIKRLLPCRPACLTLPVYRSLSTACRCLSTGAVQVRYVLQPDIVTAALGVQLLHGFLQAQAPVLDPAHWAIVLRALSLASELDVASYVAELG